jgi:glucose/arabinose dehydrogenase
MIKHKRLTISIVIASILLVLIIVFVGYWLFNNTSFFTSKIDSDELAQNNLNVADGNIVLIQYQIGEMTLNIPKGFEISEYATGIGSARFFSFNEQNTMFVGTNSNDKIYAVRDTDNNGLAETVNEVDSGLNSPHSTFYHEGDLYLGEENRVSVYRGIKDDGSYISKEIIVDNLPSGNKLTGGGHKTRTVLIGPDNMLYVSIGSSCNVCIEDDDRRAAIVRYNLDGSGEEIYATGLRNTVGFEFDSDGTIWGVDMGRDQIGDDIPPEEVNIIESGKDYGWPYCYGDKINNPEFSDKVDYCLEQTEKPYFNMQAHSAPLGMSFLNDAAKESWPSMYKNGFLVAFHGSWNRTVPTGYKVVWIDTSGAAPQQYNFLSGWLEESADAWGRPVGLGFDSNGNLYVSDDKQGMIYKVSYTAND